DGPTETFGTRYIFAAIDQTEFATRFRCNLAFSPDLTIELYAEPFTASGVYSGFGELAAAGSDVVRIYGADADSEISYDSESGVYTATDRRGSVAIMNPDFRYLSFRSNVVLRWEWMRGSTLFLVWQQDRFAFERRG